MLQTVLVLRKHFLFLSSSLLCCLLYSPGCTTMGSGSAEAHSTGTVQLRHPHIASRHKTTDLDTGVHNHGKSLSPVFPREVTKKIPVHTIIDNYQMPKNDNHLSCPFLSNMCSPPAKCAAHVAAARYKNRSKNIYFYLLRTNLCSQLLNSNTTVPSLLRRSIAIQLGNRERHLKLCCRVLSISYRKKGRVQNVQTLCQSMPGAAWLVNKGGTERRFSSCH